MALALALALALASKTPPLGAVQHSASPLFSLECSFPALPFPRVLCRGNYSSYGECSFLWRGKCSFPHCSASAERRGKKNALRFLSRGKSTLLFLALQRRGCFLQRKEHPLRSAEAEQRKGRALLFALQGCSAEQLFHYYEIRRYVNI